jgi:YidC/Oxa1 family membrane protein insertase
LDNRRLLIAAFLCMALVVVWSILFPPKPPDTLPGEQPPAAQAPAGPAGPAERSGPPASPSAPAERPAPGLSAVPPALAQPIAASREEKVTLAQGSTEAVFTNRGAQLVSLEVGGARNQGSVDLVRHRKEGPFPFGLTTGDRRSHPLNDALFAMQRSADGRSLTFRYNGPQGAAEKTFSFTPEGLIRVRVSVPGHRGWGVVLGPGIRNEPP